MQRSDISWTDFTWNPCRGCSHVSDGCENCYPETFGGRFCGPGLSFEGFVKRVHGKPHWTGKVQLLPHKLREPGRVRTPQMVFVGSMFDLVHEKLPFSDIDKVFASMAEFHWHTYQILTKRPERMLEYFRRLAKSRPGGLVYEAVFGRANAILGTQLQWPMENVHVGVTAENEITAKARIPLLRKTPAVVRFLSNEPALTSVNWKRWLRGIDGMVCGGESGTDARPMQLWWARAARDACEKMGVAFHFKQWGEYGPDHNGWMVRFGRKATGRVLDGRTHDDWPKSPKPKTPKKKRK